MISITDSPAAPVCKESELALFVSAASPTFGSSIIGPLFLVHVLTSALAISLGEQAKKALEEQTASCTTRAFSIPSSVSNTDRLSGGAHAPPERRSFVSSRTLRSHSACRPTWTPCRPAPFQR